MPTCTVQTKTKQSYKYIYLGDVWTGDQSISMDSVAGMRFFSSLLWRWTQWLERGFFHLCRNLHIKSTLRKTLQEWNSCCSGMALAHSSLSPQISQLPAWMASWGGTGKLTPCLKACEVRASLLQNCARTGGGKFSKAGQGSRQGFCTWLENVSAEQAAARHLPRCSVPVGGGQVWSGAML